MMTTHNEDGLVLSYEPMGCAINAALPRMTLLILFYNQCRDVLKVVSAALAQDYENSEIILSDDGSSDGTGELLLEFVKNYNGRHHLVVNVNTRNLGIGNHFKKAFAFCTGEWIVTSGGDDISFPQRLSRIAEYAKRFPNASAIGSASRQIGENGAVIREAVEVSEAKIYPRYQGGHFEYELSPTGMARMAFIAGALAAWRRDVIRLHSFPMDVIAEDVVLSLRAILIGDILFVPDVLVDRRIGGISFPGHRYSKRSDRVAYRRRVARMFFLSVAALSRELEDYSFVVSDEFRQRLHFDAAVSLLRCFALPTDRAVEYRLAISLLSRKIGFVRIVKHAFAGGNLLKFIWVLLKSLTLNSRSVSYAKIRSYI